MSTSEITRLVEASPRFKARIAIAFYLLTILTGAVVFFFGGMLGYTVDVIASVFYIAMTSLFYLFTRGA